MGYSIANTIVPLLSGPFFGRFGKWAGVTVIAATITTGIFIVWFGMLASNFWVVLLGRTIYGLGGESVFVGVDILVTKWFRGAEIGFAYGLIQAAGQAGSFTVLYTVPSLVEHYGNSINEVCVLQQPRAAAAAARALPAGHCLAPPPPLPRSFFLSVLLACIAFTCLGLARLIEKTAYGKKRAKLVQQVGDAHLMEDDTAVGVTRAGGFAASVLDDALRAKEREAAAAAKKGAAAAAGGKRDKPMPEERLSLLKDDPVSIADGELAAAAEAAADEAEEEAAQQDTDVVSPALQAQLEDNLRLLRCIPPLYHAFLFLGFGHLVTLSWRFYAVMGGIICYSSAFYTFLAFGPAWLQATFQFSDVQAGQTAGIIAIFSMIVSPTMGLVMDKRGGQRYVCFAAMLSSMLWFVVMGFSAAPPQLSIVFAGISYSLLPASLYPLLPEVVPAESFTIVYAVLNAAINLVFTAVLAIAGVVLGADTAALGATRGAQAAALGARALHAAATAMEPRHLQAWANDTNICTNSCTQSAENAGEALPEAGNFKYVFTMFVTITSVGCIATGAIALDAYRSGNAWTPLAAHH